jgi:hypothetical protein
MMANPKNPSEKYDECVAAYGRSIKAIINI